MESSTYTPGPRPLKGDTNLECRSSIQKESVTCTSLGREWLWILGLRMNQLSLSLSKTSTPQKISVRVLQAFRPFTFSQVVVAELQSGVLPLPPRFVIKFSDPRHIPNRIPLMRELDQERSTSPWSPRFRDFFTAHLRDFRTKRWPNHWKCTGATQPVTRQERINKDEDFYDDWFADREGTLCLWSQEMDHWEQTFESHSNEMAVYQALESLQGHSIPCLFGSGTYKPPIYGFDDPLLSSVPFLALEYIPGAPLHHIQLAATISTNPSSPPQITPPDAKRAAHAIIDVARAIRNLGVNNPDFAARNIIFAKSGSASSRNHRFRPGFSEQRAGHESAGHPGRLV
ncbi:hypothetical protein MIND_00794100 [Mycena indigotica]|uniref:Protein kinase domain-containing protein n=1 Tax=Mycena indigotica TaxID=2126181 RepID=A0A8H6SM26_9AGAR|nr:uncharacterized protein MIND_00794100 [Mycena indigotica]KAF7302270.1 hypothetical protein MIND_00794100 [Mycena indigotica]